MQTLVQVKKKNIETQNNMNTNFGCNMQKDCCYQLHVTEQISSCDSPEALTDSIQPACEKSVSTHSTTKHSIINTSICILALCAHTLCFTWRSVNSRSVSRDN